MKSTLSNMHIEYTISCSPHVQDRFGRIVRVLRGDINGDLIYTVSSNAAWTEKGYPDKLHAEGKVPESIISSLFDNFKAMDIPFPSPEPHLDSATVSLVIKSCSGSVEIRWSSLATPDSKFLQYIIRIFEALDTLIPLPADPHFEVIIKELTE